MAMKWKRSSPGHYASGDIEIKKGIGIDSDKWWIYFPDGKASYRRSYEAAKSWAEKYMSRENTAAEPAKKQPAQKQPRSLKDKLLQNGSYIVGTEFIGCINTGKAACILHIPTSDRSYYIVGEEGGVTDTMFDKTPLKIKRDLKNGIYNREYETRLWGTVVVYDQFEIAEKHFQDLNNKQIAENNAHRAKIAAAKNKAANGTIEERTEAWFELNDYGLM